MAELADKHDVTMTEVSLAWLLTKISGLNTVGIVILVVIAVVIAFLNRVRIQKEVKAMKEGQAA